MSEKPHIWRFSHEDNFSEESAKSVNSAYGEHKKKVLEFVEYSAYEELKAKLETALSLLDRAKMVLRFASIVSASRTEVAFESVRLLKEIKEIEELKGI